jgi:DNA-binding MarR family transcriptional regulator
MTPRPAKPAASPERPALARLHEAVYAFTASERQLVANYKRADGSLSPGRLSALNVLVREQEAPAGRLAREAGLKPNSITAMLEQLEHAGLVRRRQDDHDRRVWWISLTDAGRAEISALQDDWNRRFDAAFADVSDRELAAASRVLERLAGVFRDFDPDAG